MSGGGHSDVKNAIWMRALLMAGIILGLGVASYVGLGVVVAGMKETTWDEEADHFHDAENDWKDAVAAGTIASDNESAELFIAKEAAHHHEIDAHLSYLTYRVAGLTMLFVSIIFTAFLAISGILNSAQPDDEHHDDHHGHEEHHGSASPIIFAFGCMLFLIGFPDFADGLHSLMLGSGTDAISDLSVGMIGLTIITIGIANWWREDLPFKGYGEQIATSDPFSGQHIRKAGIWVFLMSEVMVFATFFSSYLRMRTEWCTKWAYDEGICTLEDGETLAMTASDYLRPGGAAGTGDFWTLLPGAINTFALIVSSYTIVLALKIAKSHDYKVPSGLMGKLMPDKKSAIRNYLIITLALGTMFIVLKLVEWSHLIAEGFTVGSQEGSIFYISTGAHGVHVFAGLLIMLYMIFKADTVEWDEDNAQGIEYFGLYWHFVDLAWVVIFPAFYLY
ncbi:MAG: heme-copper oxidase subunit III [Candidatus Poseidoniales archaeon]|nr:MAG: heme-copper oxidase subunit III [Candidatus Poseidoniales archaeon]